MFSHLSHILKAPNVGVKYTHFNTFVHLNQGATFKSGFWFAEKDASFVTKLIPNW